MNIPAFNIGESYGCVYKYSQRELIVDVIHVGRFRNEYVVVVRSENGKFAIAYPKPYIIKDDRGLGMYLTCDMFYDSLKELIDGYKTVKNLRVYGKEGEAIQRENSVSS